MKKILFFILAIMLLSCIKTPEIENKKTAFDFIVPKGFDWDNLIEQKITKSNTEHYYGTLWFEDTYPSFGDNDMNDFVANYKTSHHYVNGSNYKVGSTTISIQVLATGGTQQIGFGFVYETLSKNKFKKIKVLKNDVEIPVDINFFKQGNTNYENYMTVDITNNIHKEFGVADTVMINTTTKRYPIINYVVYIEFEPINKITNKGIDFYITKEFTENKRIEIHTFGNFSTSLATNNYADFHNENKVWGLRLDIQNLPYSKELINIFEAYPQLKQYVISNKKQNKYWYIYPIDKKVIN